MEASGQDAPTGLGDRATTAEPRRARPVPPHRSARSRLWLELLSPHPTHSGNNLWKVFPTQAQGPLAPLHRGRHSAEHPNEQPCPLYPAPRAPTAQHPEVPAWGMGSITPGFSFPWFGNDRGRKRLPSEPGSNNWELVCTLISRQCGWGRVQDVIQAPAQGPNVLQVRRFWHRGFGLVPAFMAN